MSPTGVAGRRRPSWDGGGRRTVKDAGRKLFFRYVRFKDGGGPRTDKISSKRTGADERPTLYVRLKDAFGRRTGKILKNRTQTDAGRTLFVRLEDGFGRRTVKALSKRTEADAGQTPSVRLKDGGGRRAKADQVRSTSPGHRHHCGSDSLKSTIPDLQ